MTFPRRILPASILFLAGATAWAAPDLSLSGIFSDHMVLQRDQPITIRGTSTPGDTVKATLGDDSAEVTADGQGQWTAELPARKPGGPLIMTVSDADETTSIQDILIGDVWFCSGQSNMDFVLRRSAKPKAAIQQSANSNLRLYKVPRQKSVRPQSELNPASNWEVAGPDTVADFSAVGYYFGKRLQEEVDIPIGLIHSAWGGTRVQWWTPLEGLEPLEFYQPELATVVTNKTDRQLLSAYRQSLNQWLEQVASLDPGNRNSWAAKDLDVSDWNSTDLPENKNQGTLSQHDGTAWYRRSFSLTAEQAEQSYTVEMPCIDDLAIVHINGRRIGRNPMPLRPVNLEIPAGLLQEGENLIAVQVIDFGRGGGICGKPDGLKLTSASGSIGLAGDWKYRIALPLKEMPQVPVAPANIRPTVLYNAMVAPFREFPIAGVIWYQGEGNASQVAAPHYAEAFSAMITHWRKNWNIGDFPFLFVQLAGFRDIQPEPGESDWAVLREQQEKTLSLVPNTAMASAIDVGEEKDIHPKDKQTVGNRLAQAALALKYGQDVEPMGPIYKSSEISGNKVTITFDHADGLKTKNGEPLKGFAIAGADGKFVWADATIEGANVVVSSDKVEDPKAVRYGWADFSIGNLYNSSGLPASPFRTDKPQ